MYDVTVGPRAEETVQEIIQWYRAMGGREIGFRFKDFADYKSCHIQSDPTPLDQPVQIVLGHPNQFQLVKEYIYGPRIQVRQILKPIAATITIEYNGGAYVSGVDYTLDDTTGIITVPGTIDPNLMSWGGEFDVPVRFNSELPVSIVDKEIETVNFSLLELRSPYDSLTAGFQRRGTATLHFSSTANLTSFNVNARIGHADLTFTQSTPTLTNASPGGGDFNFVMTVDSTAGYSVGLMAADDNGLVLIGDGNANAMYASTDGGQTFAPGAYTLPGGGFAAFGPMIGIGTGIFLAGDDGTSGDVWRSTDGGVTWTNIACFTASFETPSGFATDGTTILAVGNLGAVATSTNNGASWTLHSIPAGIDQFLGNYSFASGSQLIYGDGEFAAVCFDSGSGNTKLGTSTNGVTWSFTSIGSETINCIDWDGSLYGAVLQTGGSHTRARFSSTFAGIASASDINVDVASGMVGSNSNLIVHDRHGTWGVFNNSGEVAFSTNPTSAPTWQYGDAGYGGGITGDRPIYCVYDSVHDELIVLQIFSGSKITTRP